MMVLSGVESVIPTISPVTKRRTTQTDLMFRSGKHLFPDQSRRLIPEQQYVVGLWFLLLMKIRPESVPPEY